MPTGQALARFYSATDIVEERVDEGVARIKELASGLSAHSAVEAVGWQESFTRAVRVTSYVGQVGQVGVNYDAKIPGIELFFAGIHTLGDPTPVHRLLDLIQPICDRTIGASKVFDLVLPLEQAAEG